MGGGVSGGGGAGSRAFNISGDIGFVLQNLEAVHLRSVRGV